MPTSNPFNDAHLMAELSKLSAKELGEISSSLRKAAALFKKIKDKQLNKDASLLLKYANGFNRAAGKCGKLED